MQWRQIVMLVPHNAIYCEAIIPNEHASVYKGYSDVKITIQISIVYAILLFPGALQVSYNLHLTINTSGLLLDRTH